MLTWCRSRTGETGGYAPGERGGLPVSQAAALESPEFEKGGSYSRGARDNGPGFGIGGRRQFGVCDVVYTPRSPVPRVRMDRIPRPEAHRPDRGADFSGRSTFANF